MLYERGRTFPRDSAAVCEQHRWWVESRSSNIPNDDLINIAHLLPWLRKMLLKVIES